MRRIALITVVLGVSACGGDDDTGGDPDPLEGALCDVYETVCARQAECGVFVLSSETDIDTCMAELNCEGLTADAAENGILVNEEKAQECKAALTDASCQELLPWLDGSQTQIFVANESCQNLLEGTLEEGEACIASAECGEGLACAGETCPGTCLPEGSDVCEVGTCGDGRVCTSSGCEARAGDGEVCRLVERENSCVDGFHCDWDPNEPEPRCVPQIAENNACSLISYFTCAGGLVCNNNTCTDATPLGNDCSAADECGIDAFCDFNNGQTCIAAKALGASCDGDVFGECGDYLCTDGFCSLRADEPDVVVEVRPFVGEGADCLEANCDAGLVCWPNDDASQFRCQPKFELGESCMPATDAAQLAVLFSLAGVSSCESGLCDVFANEWTCVSPAGAGEACEGSGLTLQCQSAICGAGTCTEVFPDECPRL